MSVRELVTALRRRWWLIAAVTAVSGTVTFVVSSSMPPTYVASSRVVAVVVGTHRPTEATEMTEGLAAEQFTRSRIPEYTSFASTATFLQRVVDNHRLPMTRDELSNSLSMSSPRGTALITVTVRSQSPELAAQVSNASADELAGVVQERDRLLPVRTLVVERASAPKASAAPQVWRTVIQAGLLGAVLTAAAVAAGALFRRESGSCMRRRSAGDGGVA